MKIGLIGPSNDPHCLRLKEALQALNAEGWLIDSTTFDGERRYSFRGRTLTYQGEPMDEVPALYLRSVLSPVPEVFVEDHQYKLYEDWHQSYMIAREKHGFLLSWMLALLDQGKILVNPPRQGTVSLLKPYQLFQLMQLGFPVPRTLVTNDPREAMDFVQTVGRVVCKPVLGGAFCERVTEETFERLPLIERSPVMFQEEIAGPDIRVTAVRGKVLSAVWIHSDQVDFRATEAYEQGQEEYETVSLPPEVEEMCFQAMEATGLYFSGIDLKKVGDRYVILELNFSPAFLAIEGKTGHPITEGLAKYLLFCGAQAPTRPRNFFHYGVPSPP